jgi:hypothetical protein
MKNEPNNTHIPYENEIFYLWETSDASLPHNNDATEPLITRNERDERKKQSIEPSLAWDGVVGT